MTADKQNVLADLVRVKPLVFSVRPEDGSRIKSADCPFGRYRIADRGEYGWGWSRPGYNPFNEIVGSEEQAEAAAQADYERRILSAIEVKEDG